MACSFIIHLTRNSNSAYPSQTFVAVWACSFWPGCASSWPQDPDALQDLEWFRWSESFGESELVSEGDGRVYLPPISLDNGQLRCPSLHSFDDPSLSYVESPSKGEANPCKCVPFFSPSKPKSCFFFYWNYTRMGCHTARCHYFHLSLRLWSNLFISFFVILFQWMFSVALQHKNTCRLIRIRPMFPSFSV